MKITFLKLGFLIILLACTVPRKSIHQLQSEAAAEKTAIPHNISKVRTGLDVLLDSRMDEIEGKSIGLVTNLSGIDHAGQPNFERFLALENVDLKIIFSPEHGLFGEAANGEKVEYKGELRSLPPLVSLYGKNRKPDPESLRGLDLIIYDIQDIGARFYTYISTLGMVMEAAAEAGIPVLVLDRPNPITGRHVEGPPLNLEFQSFVGYYPIPIRYGLTVGEMARMISGEKWINEVPALEVIPMRGWNRNLWYDQTDLLWKKPSPNIPDLITAIIYPGLCLLEATNISEGRGTRFPFKWIGAPWIDGKLLAVQLNDLHLPGLVFKPITFVPREIKGMAFNPKFEGQKCSGVEIMLIDRNVFKSVYAGLAIINKIQELYPEQVEIKASGVKRLWGDSEFPRELNPVTVEKFKTLENEFKKRTLPYLLYD
ncbi:MAG: DUF1343 domain-containing protein [Candidatus Neomarinimicrobiota bacterium]